MKPKPLAELNHFTVPIDMRRTLSLLSCKYASPPAALRRGLTVEFAFCFGSKSVAAAYGERRGQIISPSIDHSYMGASRSHCKDYCNGRSKGRYVPRDIFVDLSGKRTASSIPTERQSVRASRCDRPRRLSHSR